MQEPEIPKNEAERLAALAGLKLLDSAPEERFDRVTRLACRIFDVPIALVTLVDRDRQWFKARVGLTAEQTGRNISFCGHAILNDETFVVEDTSADPRFQGNPLVQGKPHIRFYAGRPLRTDEGYRVGTLCIIDRTPRKLSESDLAILDDLGAMVETELRNVGLEELNARLTQTQTSLEAAMSSVAAAARQKDEFLRNVSHELRTPMTSIVGLTELMMDDEQANDATSRYVQTIDSSAKLLLNLIDDLLVGAQLEAGKIVLDPHPFPLRASIEATLLGLRPLVERKGLALECHVDPDVPDRLNADFPRIGQILVNLIGNAIKFTDEGGIDVRVELVSRVPDSLRVKFLVADTGIGIRSEDQERVFQAFAQADDAATRKVGGTGLGLSIARRMVEVLGGKLELKSEPGAGSLFSFVLELKEDSAPRAAMDSAPDAQNDIAEGLSVLVVDDVPTSRMVIGSMLEKMGCIVAMANDGAQAFDRWREGEIDLILMDIHMPEVDGLEATRRIRQEEGVNPEAGVPIFGLSAGASDSDRLCALDAGMTDYLTKPVTVQALRAALSSAADAFVRAPS